MGRLSPPVDLLPMESAAETLDEPRGPAAVAAEPVPTLPLALMVSVALTAAVVLVLTLSLVPAPLIAPELSRLLHGMVLIKGLIGLAGGALVFWRLGRPIARPLAARYIASLCLSAAAVAWLWGLQLILLGGVLFYAGLVGLFLVARQDPLLSDVRRRQT